MPTRITVVFTVYGFPQVDWEEEQITPDGLSANVKIINSGNQ